MKLTYTIVNQHGDNGEDRISLETDIHIGEKTDQVLLELARILNKAYEALYQQRTDDFSDLLEAQSKAFAKAMATEALEEEAKP